MAAGLAVVVHDEEVTDDDDGQNGGHDGGRRDGGGGRALEPLAEAAARVMTAGIRVAIADVERSVAVLAHRVRAAHDARVWTVLGYGSWAGYAQAEFGVSRAQAYRLIAVARAAAVIDEAVAGAVSVSRTRDTGTETGAGLDYGLSQRALLAVSARSGDVAAMIAARLTALTADSTRGLPADTVRDVVQHAVDAARAQELADQTLHQVRTALPAAVPATAATVAADPRLAELHQAVDDLTAASHAIGELMLEVAPAYLSDQDAAEAVAPLCEEIGQTVPEALAARRYAITGDRRALAGTVL